MSFAETLIYAADTLETLSGNRFVQLGALIVALVLASSFAFGNVGQRIRAGLIRLGVFALIGAGGTLAMVAVKGVPESETAAAPAPAKTEPGVDQWIARQQRLAEAERAARQERSSEARAVEAARLRLVERVEARQALERERGLIRRTPEAERTADQRRRDAHIEVRLAEIDRIEGRIDEAIRRYRAAQAVFARLADPQSRRAGVEVALDTASTLEERHDTEAARAVYRSAIADQRGLAALPERERRDGLASALVRYATFEIGRREEKPARAALDEARSHYAFLRAQRGTFDVVKARAELAIAIGDRAAARAELASLRALLAQPSLAALASDVDAVEGNLLLIEARPAEAVALFARAAAALRGAIAGERRFDAATRRKLVTVLLGLAEAGYMARDLAAARRHAGEAVAIRRALAEPARLATTLTRVALWEAGAGNAETAERTLTAALDERRKLAEVHPDPESEGAMRLLCAGVLRERAVCRAVPDADATGAGP